MKRVFILTGLSLLTLLSCNQRSNNGTDLISNSTDSANAPVMSFEKPEYDFGSIKSGEKVSMVFRFKNTGKSDLVISETSVPCSCTKPTYSKEPVAPGEEGEIDVEFDSYNKTGYHNSKVNIIANTVPSTNIIGFKGNIK